MKEIGDWYKAPNPEISEVTKERAYVKFVL